MNLDAFGFGKIQDFQQLLNMAAADGVTDIRLLQQKLAGYIQNQRHNVHTAKRKVKKAAAKRQAVQAVYPCSKCKELALVERVNVCPSTAIGGPWKSSISCKDPACLHIELSEKTVAEVIK